MSVQWKYVYVVRTTDEGNITATTNLNKAVDDAELEIINVLNAGWRDWREVMAEKVRVYRDGSKGYQPYDRKEFVRMVRETGAGKISIPSEKYVINVEQFID